MSAARIVGPRWLFPAAVALICAFFAGRDAMLAVLSRANPVLAVAISPDDPRAAPAVLDQKARAGVASAHEPAVLERLRAGLLQKPLSSQILRLIASRTASSDPRAAAVLQTVAADVSRRDLFNELALAERAARSNVSATAMRHINAALSTNKQAAELAFPLLVGTLSDAEFRRTVPGYMDRPWSDEFLLFAARNAGAADVLELALRSPAVQVESRFRTFRGELLTHLIAEGEAHLAIDYARRILGARSAVLAEPGLNKATADPSFAPLTWTPINSQGIFGDWTGNSLVVSVDPGARGEAVSRVLSLRPGPWQMTVATTRLTEVQDFKAGWQVVCLRAASKIVVAEWGAVPAGGSAAIRKTFTVPAGCDALRLGLSVSNADDQSAAELQIAKLTLQHLGG